MIFISCNAPRGVLYSEALTKVQENPKLSLQVCDSIVHEEDRSDCLVWGAHQLLKTKQTESAGELCSKLSGPAAHECAFMLAEVSGHPDDCAKTGPFERDCRLHLLNKAVRSHSTTDHAASIDAVGLNPDAREPWTVIHRFVLEKSPLNLSTCDQLPHSKDCLEAGEGLFHDYLRRMRDQGVLSCEPLNWPERFQYVPHPSLDPILDSYLETLPCSG